MSVQVNGHHLPAQLVALIESGEWATNRVTRVPVDDMYPGSGLEILTLKLFTIEEMVKETQSLCNETEPIWFGAKNLHQPPGDIDPKHAVVIADNGPDQPIALDYRLQGSAPALITLHWSSRGEDHNRWVTMSWDLQRLVELANDVKDPSGVDYIRVEAIVRAIGGVQRTDRG